MLRGEEQFEEENEEISLFNEAYLLVRKTERCFIQSRYTH